METDEYQASLLAELGAANYDELMPKIEEAIERLNLIPGLREHVEKMAVKMNFDVDVAFLLLFSCELWSGTLELLKGGGSLGFLDITT